MDTLNEHDEQMDHGECQSLMQKPFTVTNILRAGTAYFGMALGAQWVIKEVNPGWHCNSTSIAWTYPGAIEI